MNEKNWTGDQEEYVIDNYGNMDMNELSWNLEKTKLQIYEFVSFLRKKKNKKIKYILVRWTKKEKRYLINNYYKMNIDILSKKLNKTRKQIYDYVSLLRTKYGINIKYKPKRLSKKSKGDKHV